MNTHPLSLAGARLIALPSGALLWPERRTLAVSDLHLGKAERMARRGGGLLPPYETAETLARLRADLDAWAPDRVICVGDSFDDAAAAAHLSAQMQTGLAALLAGRDWVWVAGNHDPSPLALGGRSSEAFALGPLVFRHIAQAGAAAGEVSGHYHPKASVAGRGRRVSRRCFLTDGARLILPAYGCYTGGLHASQAARAAGLGYGAVAILTGPTMVRLPVLATAA